LVLNRLPRNNGERINPHNWMSRTFAKNWTDPPGGLNPTSHDEDKLDLALRPPATRRTEAVLLARATVEGFRNRLALRDVEVFFLLLGYARSGSTLVGSLLDAHPNMVVAHEADILRYLRPGVSQRQLFALLLLRSRQFQSIERRWHGFDYTVPGGFQGGFTTLRVVGDKHAGRATRRLWRDPQLLDRLRTVVKVPIRVLHVTRNPFDNIASTAQNRDLSLSESIDVYAKLSTMADSVRGRLAPGELLDVTYESVVADPRRRLSEICTFVGVGAPSDYLESCAALVRPAPTLRRSSAAWSPAERRRVEELIASRPVLAGYSSDS
jgi:Sulfotransferase family